MSVFFWNAFAGRYARQPIANPEAYETKLAATRALLTPSSAVLEFGCGTGSTALLHAPKVSSILALDTSPRMIDIATAKAAAAGIDNVRFGVGTVFDADPGPYDVVLALNVLHLVPDLAATVRRCHALLKPGGALVASTACITGGWEPWLLPLPGALGLLPRVRFFSTEALVQAHVDAGLTVESCTFPSHAQGAFTIARR
ncbi:MAG: 2-polyprenyl-3-methyl-5-hydroxy-6-metoxy-1,4-benzoquinol methylase [Myxococcota bacterium]|jgi:2-polyprenyl-3-methyl-5-hydroxy-6-metoxy-1,4-benzoquinol methylase